MIQVLITHKDFPEDWNGFSDEVKDSIQNKELWSDTEWIFIETARATCPKEIFREITINS
jgi:hypothetical protein